MKIFLAAIQFLTVIPLPSKLVLSVEHISRATKYFPLVGMLIGAILAGTSCLLSALPSSINAAILLTVLYVITGAFHLDGLADSFDGLYGMRTKERRLEIMRDSSVGVMGVTAILLVVLLKFTIISNMDITLLWKSLLLMCVFGRWAQTFACYAFKYAREDGKASLFVDNTLLKDILAATAFMFLLTLVLFSYKGLVLVGTAFLFTLFFMLWVKSKIDGMTGDTIGASNEIAELSFLLAVLIFNCLGVIA